MLYKSSRLNSVIGTALLLLFAFDNSAVGEEVKPNVPQPRVDEQIELLGIVFRLAGVEEVPFKEYDDAIQKHFAPFKTHPVVFVTHRARYKIPMPGTALHISIENGRVVLPNADSEKTLEKLVNSQFTLKAAQLFVKQLDDFYVKSRFHEFFESHQEMYRETEQRIKAINDKIDYSWFKEFYGEASLEHLHIILTFVGDGGYSPSIRFKDEHEECFAILTVDGPDVPHREGGFIALIVHEFNHFFCDSIVKEYIDELIPASERVFPFVSNNASRYYSAKTMVYEYVVRACMVRYLLYCGNGDEAERQMRMDRRDGFFWIEELVELFGRYEKERDKYPTLADFMPEIVKMQNEIVTDEYIAELQKRE